MPKITGTINNIEGFLPAKHTYYGDGGGLQLWPALSGNGGPNYDEPRGGWWPGRWGRGQGRTVQLPRDWWDLFRNGGAGGGRRADGIRVGPGNNNLRDYVRCDGASARLRIWYTQ